MFVRSLGDGERDEDGDRVGEEFIVFGENVRPGICV